MGYNGPILPLCQEPCVEWWRVGSKLLTCQGNEMSVLTLVLQSLRASFTIRVEMPLDFISIENLFCNTMGHNLWIALCA